MVETVVRNARHPLLVLCADREGERFRIVVGLYCNSVAGDRQVIFALSTPQRLRSCKQK